MASRAARHCRALVPVEPRNSRHARCANWTKWFALYATPLVLVRPPVQAVRGSPLRQYHPVEFGWEPAGKTKGKGENKKPVPQMRTYGTSLVQDNYWCVPPGDAGSIWWFLVGDLWTPQLVKVLECCLERLIYFGRSETLTSIKCENEPAMGPNCLVNDRPPSPNSVRVLVPRGTPTALMLSV